MWKPFSLSALVIERFVLIQDLRGGAVLPFSADRNGREIKHGRRFVTFFLFRFILFHRKNLFSWVVCYAMVANLVA